MKRLLVTGVHGFVGSTLAKLTATDPSLAQWQLVPISERLDLLEQDMIRETLSDGAPDAVLHLAGRSSVAESLRDPRGTLEVNVIGTLNLLRALVEVHFSGPMVFVSSGDVYGMVPEHALPIAETWLPAPRNPYAVSKLAAEALCHQWSITSGMHIVIARPFNHIGPGQSEQFAIAAFARQIREIREGKRPPVVEVGDIEVTRDFTDVRDIVYAYFALLDRGVSGERYNVCSGQERTVRSLLERLIELAGVRVDIVQDAERMRPSEQRRAVGDARKIGEATGWMARTPIDSSLAGMLGG